MGKKNDTAEAVLILVTVVTIMIITYGGSKTDKKILTSSRDTSSQTSLFSGSQSQIHNNGVREISSSPPRISIGTGNASYVFQPNEEYITLYNSGEHPVNITGWQLKNGKGKRTYYLGGSLRRFPSDIAFIPRAALFISPFGESLLKDVILKPGESAIITTGRSGSNLPYKIVSFKENICSGYLEEMPEYSFYPPLSRNCPRPADEPDLENLDIPCRKFVERLPSCRIPKFDLKDRDGNPCNSCVNGERLSSACAAFIKDRFNYSSCVARHAGDTNFYLGTWRIFLNQGWEMWAREYETIELFDQLGRLINSRSY